MDEKYKDLTNEEMAAVIKDGGNGVVAQLFEEFKTPLARMIHFRLDRRLYGRIDAGDVLQDAFLTINDRYLEFVDNPAVSVYVWMRQVTFQTLLAAHRKHFGVQKRNVNREVTLNHADKSNATSLSIATHLAADLTSPSHAAMRDERAEQLNAALETMDEIDREVLALRHFEQLSNKEVSEILSLSKTAASNRYIRAMERLKVILDSMMATEE